MSQSGIVGSYGNYIFNLFRTSPTGIHAHQQVTNVSICLHVGSTLLFSAFLKKNRFPVLQKRSSQDCLHNSVSVRNTACLRAQLSRCVWPFVTLRTVAHQAPQSMALSTLDCSGLHALLQGILSNQGIRPTASALQADSLLLSHQGSLSLTLVNCKIQSGYGGKFLCYVHLTTIFKN